MPRNKYLALGLLGFVLPLCCHAAEVKTLKGKVVGVTDGDTITVLDHSREQHKIRLARIDSPEGGQDYSQKAKQALSGMIFGRPVTVTYKHRDRYRRIIGEVTHRGTNINEKVVAEGWAWQFRKYDKGVQLQALEKKAREKHLGLWAEENPVPPWEWRKKKK